MTRLFRRVMLVVSLMACSGQTLVTSSRTVADTPVNEVNVRNQHGFRLLPYLLNRDSWSSLQGAGHQRLSELKLERSDVRTVLFLVNLWSIPGGKSDIRVMDMDKHLFLGSVQLAAKWPALRVPGFIAVIELQDNRWMLVAEIGTHYAVEVDGRIGFVEKQRRGP